MVYSIDDLRQRITPIAEKYRLRAVYLFGSYARNEANDSSDVDVLVDTEGSIVRGIIIGGLYEDLCESVEKEVDMVTVDALTQDGEDNPTPWFTENVMRERVEIYVNS